MQYAAYFDFYPAFTGESTYLERHLGAPRAGHSQGMRCKYSATQEACLQRELPYAGCFGV
jgi:hypothetical protein